MKAMRQSVSDRLVPEAERHPELCERLMRDFFGSDDYTEPAAQGR